MVLRFFSTTAVGMLVLLCSAATLAQTATPTPSPIPTAESTPQVRSSARPTAPTAPKGAKATTSEEVVETSLFLYGFPYGRATLNQIRKTAFEKGTSTITNAEGKSETVNYQRYVIRGEKLSAEKIRLDQQYPSATFSLIYSGDRTYGIYNNTVFSPRPDAARSFENVFARGLEGFLRYKENGSTLGPLERAKVMGVDYYVIDITDTQKRTTRYYVSAKSWRVMMLTYEEDGVRYRRKYYDYNYAQGTLVPYRTVLWANDKIVEETDVGTITFGQKVDEALFASS